jgi:hypothetical protein
MEEKGMSMKRDTRSMRDDQKPDDDDVADESEASADELPAKLRKPLERIRGWMTDDHQAGARNNYRIGREVAAIMADEDRYGKGAVEQLARALGCSAALLYGYAKLMEAWPDGRAYEALVKRTNGNGIPLTVSHLITLSRVNRASTREDLLTRAFEESWTVRQLEQHVPQKKTRRPKETPTDIAARVARTADHTVKAIGIDLDALGKLTLVHAEDGEVRGKLEAALERSRRAETLSGQVVAKLEALLRHGAPTGDPPSAPQSEPSPGLEAAE